MNWYKIFYALTVSDGVKSFFDTTSNIFTFFAVLSFIALVIISVFKAATAAENKIKDDASEKVDPETRTFAKARVWVRNFFYVMLGLSLVTWVGWAATPTKKDCVMIIAGGGIATFLTSDTNARKIPAELTKLSVVAIQSWQDQIKDMSIEDKKAIGIQTPEEKKKEDLKQKLVGMTKEEIIKFIEGDSTLLK